MLVLPAGSSPQPAAADARTAAPSARTVTLITGDRVTLRGDAVDVRPARGRADMVFEHYKLAGHHYVIPADATGLVNRHRLDRRLFDVTGLLALGYGDRARSDLPLIAVHKAGALSALQGADARVTDRLPSLGMSALRTDKHDAAEFWTAAANAPGVASIWLDGAGRSSWTGRSRRSACPLRGRPATPAPE